MKIQLLEKGFFVKNDENFVYKVESLETYEGYNFMNVNLTLICGWDYVSVENDIQGFVSNDRFIDDVQNITEVYYFMNESLKECLATNGYEILNKCPLILNK